MTKSQKMENLETEKTLTRTLVLAGDANHGSKSDGHALDRIGIENV